LCGDRSTACNGPAAVISTEKDTAALSFGLVVEFDAGVERVWQIWADPKQLERWVMFEYVEGRTRMTITTRFKSLEQLNQMVEMGVLEGTREAIGQVDALLAEDASV